MSRRDPLEVVARIARLRAGEALGRFTRARLRAATVAAEIEALSAASERVREGSEPTPSAAVRAGELQRSLETLLGLSVRQARALRDQLGARALEEKERASAVAARLRVRALARALERRRARRAREERLRDAKRLDESVRAAAALEAEHDALR